MVEGGCHCGSVRYAVTGEPVRVGLCHCTDCRRSAGAPMVAWAVLAEDQLQVLQGEVSTYASSEHGRRSFCPACGTGLWYANSVAMPGLVDVQSATLDDPGIFPPMEQIQVADRIVWMTDIDALPAHARFPDDL